MTVRHSSWAERVYVIGTTVCRVGARKIKSEIVKNKFYTILKKILNNWFYRVMCADFVFVCVLSRGQCVMLLVKQDMLPADVV